jgi:hypothetical protein
MGTPVHNITEILLKVVLNTISLTINTNLATMQFERVNYFKKTFISGVNNNPSWEHVVFTSSANNNVKLYRKKRLNNWTDGKWRIFIEEIRNRHFNKSQ